MANPIEKRAQEVLDQIRPQIQMDGGDVELVGVEGQTVKVRLTGHCAGCPMSTITLKNGIEVLIKEKIPEVQKVQAVQ